MNTLALWHVTRTSFINMLAYRMNYYTGIVTYTVHIAVNSSILIALQQGAGKDLGYGMSELLTFAAIGYFLRSCTFNNLDQHIAGQVNDGSMVTDLIKPVDYQMMMTARGVGEAAFRLFCFSVPIILANWLIYVVFPGEATILPPEIPLPILFVTGALAFWIFAQITFMIGLCAVYMTSISGLLRLKNLGLNLLMGLLIPLTLFPDWLRGFLDWTPFPQVSWVPVSLYMGRFDSLPGDSWVTPVMIQLGWAAVMTLLARTIWSRVKKHITVQGG